MRFLCRRFPYCHHVLRFLIAFLPAVLSGAGCAATEKNVRVLSAPPDDEYAAVFAVPDTGTEAAVDSASAAAPEPGYEEEEAGVDTATQDPGEFIEAARTLCLEGNYAAADSSLKKAIQILETAEEETEWFPASRYVDDIVSIYSEKMPSDFQIPEDIAASVFQQQMARSLDSMKLLPPESFASALAGCRNDLVYDVPMTWNERVQRALFYYVNNRRATIDRWFLRAPPYLPFMRKTFADSGLPQDLAYLPLIESGFNPKAYSYAHAAGIWQFITSTGRRYGLRHTYWLDERRDPIKSTQAAASYLKKLYGDFGHWHLAVAAYNCGENGMNRAISRSRNSDFWKMKRLPAQTRNYVPSYLAALTIAKNPACFGVTAAPADTFPCDTALVSECVSLEDIAQAVGVPYDTLKKMNPHIMRWCTPPDAADAVLYLPCGTKERFAAFLAQLPESKKVRWCRYEVRANDNISAIARRFRVPVRGVKAINRLNKNRLAVGQRLFLPLPKENEKTAADSIPPKLPKDDYGYMMRYRVRRGDCISTIARKFHVTCSQLYRWNRLSPKSILRIGRRLIVRPGPPPEPVIVPPLAPFGMKKDRGTHVVQMGDTPFSIARRSGISITDLLAWNSIDATRPIIHPGDTLLIAAPEKRTAVKTGAADTAAAAESFSSMWEDTTWTDDWASAFIGMESKDSTPAVPSVGDSTSFYAPPR